jgi:SmpA / OmlA family
MVNAAAGEAKCWFPFLESAMNPFLQLSKILAKTAFVASIGLSLVACDQAAKLELNAGMSTKEDVIRMMGQPAAVWEDKDGGQTLEYARGPVNPMTYMVKITPDGKYLNMINVLTEANFNKLSPGMSRDDVRRLLGKPGEVQPLKLANEEVWSWKYNATQPTVRMFHAHFEPGGALKKTSYSDLPIPN